MTSDEMTTTVTQVKGTVDTLTQEWGEFLELEANRREEDAKRTRRRDASESQRAAADAEAWQKGQGFLSKHGTKLLTLLFLAVTSSLAWYGSQIRGEIKAETRIIEVDAGIESNKTGLTNLKSTTMTDIRVLQKESVNQTLMMDKGFKRMDKVMLKATKLTEEDLLKIEYPPEFKTAVEDAKALKVHAEKFGN